MLNFQQYLKYKVFLSAIFLIVALSSFAQTQPYITDIQYFSTKDGLSHRDVNCIFQDKDGVTWLGTRNGLNRFDGYNFKHWLDKNHGVDLRNIRNIGQDDEGWLWLRTDKQLIFFNPITIVFQTVTERFGADNILKNITHSHSFYGFPMDADGRIYISNYRSNIMYRYHSSEGLTTLKLPIKANTHLIVTGEKEGELYHIEDLNGYQENSVNYIFEVDKIREKEVSYKLKKGTHHTSYLKAKNQSYKWIISPDNLPKLYTKNDVYLLELKETDIKYRTRDVLLDQQNKLWIGTDFGFYMISFQKNKFEFIPAPYDNLTDRNSSARGIFVDKNQLFVCFEPQLGLSNYDFTTQNWTNLQRMNYGRVIYPSKTDDFWIGKGNQVLRWNNGIKETHELERTQNGGSGFSSWCFSPSQQNDNLLWLGTHPGLFKLNIAPNVSNRLIEIKSINKFGFNIQHIAPDLGCKNCQWLCTNEGLWLFDETTEKVIEKYNWKQKGKNYLPSDNIYHLYQESKTILWIATANGIIRWNRATNKYRQITIEDGLSNNVIYAIYPDDFGNLWMSSDYGIIKMNKATFAIQNFLPKDGVGQTEFNRVSHYEYREEQGNQRLFFGGLGGITIFEPKDFQNENATIQPTLTLLKYQQFSGSEQTTIDKTVEVKKTNTITIPPNDYIYELEVGLLNYESVNNNQYLYQLNNGTWQVQRKRSIQLGQLPYGTHQLKIKAKTINNTPAANVLEYTIVIKRPFYLTWWFIVLTSISVIGLAFYLYRQRTNQLKERQIELELLVKERTAKIEADKKIIENDKLLIEEQAKELKQLDVLKSRFFANVSHELRTPLTLILGPINTTLKRGDLTNRDFTMLSKAKQSGKNLLKLVGSILDLSKMEANKMNLNETTTVFFPFIRRIISAFESHAQREGIRFNFENNIDKHLQLELDKEKLEVIINNLLSNAIKFTSRGGKVTVKVEDQKNKIKIMVADTGRGIHPDDVPNVFNRFYQSEQENAKTEGGTGIGLALSQEFVELMNGKIWVESEWTVGSQFYVTLPRKEVLGMIEIPKIETTETLPVEPLNFNGSTEAKSNKQILIVEDNYSLRDYIQTIIEPHYNIITAANGQIAYDLLLQNQNNSTKQPDLILSDIMMPEMDGYQLLEHLKSADYFRNIPVIMLTARADIQDKLKALRIGVDDYLLKPFDEEELLIRIANLLTNYEERQTFSQIETGKMPRAKNEILISDDDQKWLETVEELILKEINNSIFSNDYLAELLFISSQSLYRKIKKLTGLTPNKYIRSVRLQQAKTFLENGKSVKETAYSVGFQKVEYFSKLFKKEFGKSPSEYF